MIHKTNEKFKFQLIATGEKNIWKEMNEKNKDVLFDGK